MWLVNRGVMSVASVTHQSLAQSLLARKWGLQVNDDVPTVLQEPDCTDFDHMGRKLLDDRERLQSYVRRIVSLEVCDIKRHQSSGGHLVVVDDLPLSRVVDNFPPVVAEHMLPLVRKGVQRRLVDSLGSPSPPRKSLVPHSQQGPSGAVPFSSRSLPPSPNTIVARVTPYDDSGAPTERIMVCRTDTVIGRRHLDRSSEVLSTISRRWLHFERVDSTDVLCKLAASCPVWYSRGEAAIRVPLKTKIPLDANRLYIYHDRNDTAVCHIDAAGPGSE